MILNILIVKDKYAIFYLIYQRKMVWSIYIKRIVLTLYSFIFEFSLDQYLLLKQGCILHKVL